MKEYNNSKRPKRKKLEPATPEDRNPPKRGQLRIKGG